jgi:hypothetical protein
MKPTEDDDLTDPVRGLLETCVDSLPKVMLVVEVIRGPAINWSLEDLSLLSPLSRSDLVATLDHLRAAGILRQVPGTTYKLIYAPVTAELAKACAALCRAYDRHPLAVARVLREGDSRRSRTR